MKATLEFNLPEEGFEFRRAINGNRSAQLERARSQTLA